MSGTLPHNEWSGYAGCCLFATSQRGLFFRIFRDLMTTRPPSPTPPRKSLLRRLRLATWRQRFEWLLGALFVAVLACWLLSRMTPPWYAPLDPTDDNVIGTAGQAQTLL